MSDTEDPFLVFGRPVLGDEEAREVQRVLESRWLGTGPRVAEFERRFKAYRRAENAVAVSSCTAALHLSIVAASIGPGDEVITTALTFCATVNAVVNAGGTPVIVDVDPRTMNIDPDAVRAAITPRTRAIICVHFAGRPCEMDALLAIAEAHDLTLIEDCAHAIETEWRGASAGTLGAFGCFSFYATKNMTTGEGGMVFARRQEDAARIQRLALHGMSADAWKRFSDEGYKHYYVVDRGFKCNMMDLQAALGLCQLERVEEHHARRAALWAGYMERLAGLPLELPRPAAPDTRHGLHLFTVLIDERAAGVTRDEVLSALTRARLGVGVHYLALPEHPFYQERYGWRPESVPHATDIGRRTVSLPLQADLTEADLDRVARALRTALLPTAC
ncbi:MAG: DegT/DnrJ/EryC1/StrS family aminotransferase [Planctomycetota bacterium]